MISWIIGGSAVAVAYRDPTGIPPAAAARQPVQKDKISRMGAYSAEPARPPANTVAERPSQTA